MQQDDFELSILSFEITAAVSPLFRLSSPFCGDRLSAIQFFRVLFIHFVGGIKEACGGTVKLVLPLVGF